jgi:hypothetical protein
MTSRVFRATDPGTGQPVALKVLNPHLKMDPVSFERFKREIQITRAVNHPRVISIYEISLETDPAFLVMEFVDGPNLKELVRLKHPLPIVQVVAYLTQILETLAACHARHIIHRDLKPQNIMVTSGGELKILDFGIARMTALSDLTQTGTSLGSPEYMAPETFDTNVFDPRADLYAAGVIAFELVSGRLPFLGDSLAVLFQQHAHQAVPALQKLRGDVPPWLAGIIEKLLSKRAHERYQSAEDALSDLKAQRVISRLIPTLKRKPCLHCSKELPEVSDICWHCGQEQRPRLAPGKSTAQFEVLCDSYVDPTAFSRFLRDVFRLERRFVPGPGAMLVMGVPSEFANSIRVTAKRYGVHLSVHPIPWLRPLQDLAVLCILATVCLLVGMIVLSLFFAKPLLGVVALIVTALLGWNFTRKSNLLARLSGPIVRKMHRGVKLDELAWLHVLAPALAKKRTEALQGTIEAMMERLLIVESGVKTLTDRQRQGFISILRGCVEVANYLSEMSRDGAEARLNSLLQRQAQLVARAQDDSSRELSTVRESILAEYARADEVGALGNRFVEAQAVFSRLMAQALLSDPALSDESVGGVEAMLTEIRRGIDAWRQVRAEVRRIA